jgi:hypothetical protein
MASRRSQTTSSGEVGIGRQSVIRCQGIWLVPALALVLPVGAGAQSIGTYRWQLQPYCNVVTLHVVQEAGQYTLDGTDDQCGSGPKAAVRGMAFQNPSGSIGFGLTIVTAPGGIPVHVDAGIGITTLSGTWRDSAGNSGTFVFTPGLALPGSPRPVPSAGLAPNSITTVQIAPTAVTGDKVASRTLTTDHLADGPRAAFATSSGTVVLTSAAQVIRTVSVPVPATGTIIANASGYFALRSGGQDQAACSIAFAANSVIPGSEILVDDLGVVASTAFVPMAQTRGFTVGPPTTSFTVNFVCEERAGSVEIRNATLTALFIASPPP